MASIASRLELNPSTLTSILLALERAGWAVRQPDLRYTLGPGLIGVAEAVRETLPLSERFTQAVGELAHRAGCGASLALVGTAEMVFLSVVRVEAGDSNPEVFDVLGEVAELLAEHPPRGALHQRAFGLLIASAETRIPHGSSRLRNHCR